MLLLECTVRRMSRFSEEERHEIFLGAFDYQCCAWHRSHAFHCYLAFVREKDAMFIWRPTYADVQHPVVVRQVMLNQLIESFHAAVVFEKRRISKEQQGFEGECHTKQSICDAALKCALAGILSIIHRVVTTYAPIDSEACLHGIDCLKLACRLGLQELLPACWSYLDDLCSIEATRRYYNVHARTIQRRVKMAFVHPDSPLCRKRLMREFTELQGDVEEHQRL